MSKLLDSLFSLLWGLPTLCLILGVGVWLTIITRFAQIRLFHRAAAHFVRQMTSRRVSGQYVSGYRALCTALAATVGTGNLAGVSGAICLGGPGAVFWILLSSFLGMVIKFAEATLATRYRIQHNGEYIGGPMYMMVCGMGKNWTPMAALYCIFGVFACFGIGNAVQVNAIAASVQNLSGHLRISPMAVGIFTAILLWCVFSGGASSITRIAEGIVPLSAGAYILMCLVFLIFRADFLPHAVRAVWNGAFSPRAATCGILGSAFHTLQIGFSRGVFTNEAGMGTASIAHAGAHVSHPVQQGLMGIIEVFLDTTVICTLTALVILSSGVSIPYGKDVGAALTIDAFSAVYGKWGSLLISVFLCSFAFATILGWSLYGLRCMQFLFGSNVSRIYFVFQIIVSVGGTVLKTPEIWRISEIFNGLMLLPNMIALLLLSSELKRMVQSYLPNMEVQNADFNQC